MGEITKKYDLFVFDLDDTLISTEEYHYRAWIITIRALVDDGFKITPKSFFKIFHSQDKNSIPNYLKKLLKKNKLINNVEAVGNLRKEKNNFYMRLLTEDKDNIKMITGAKEFLENIIENKKKFVIVTNSPCENINFMIERFPILNHSSKNYYKEMYKKPKPNPECYLTVVNDFPDERKVGFEDSITGVEAMSQVKEITPFFVNIEKYIHFSTIRKNYDFEWIKDYTFLK